MRFNCLDCEKRHPGCHGQCEEYINAVKKHEQEKGSIHEQRVSSNIVVGYLAHRKRRRK
jgi:hypothetical protein